VKPSLWTRDRVASFLVPFLTAFVLLYQVLADLRIAVIHAATLEIIGMTLAVAAAAGVLAAFGPPVVRVVVLAVCVILFLDVTLHLSGVFRGMAPEVRKSVSRDDRRIADLHRIKAALDRYMREVGPLPLPDDYGEATGPEGFWQGWWDSSAADGDHDGIPFLDFLVDAGIMTPVPLDPVNQAAAEGRVRGGHQYLYFLVPPGYEYAGGTCDPTPNRWHYMLAITTLEQKPANDAAPRGSGCSCLWRDAPNFFQQHFDYVLCGSFDATPEAHAHALEILRKRAGAMAAAKKNEVSRTELANAQIYVAEDRRRVADVRRIQHGLQQFIDKIGPLPTPGEYGEADSANTGFFPGYWDSSTRDADGDGKPFLDFLADSGVMASVPLDPLNQPPPDGDPRGGRQYVYFVASPGETYEGGTCAAADKKWVYMLGITDLRSEVTRPPMNIPGSGCDCLWRKQPNFFQTQFDYVVCGTFAAPPEARARTAEFLRKHAAEELAAKQAKAAAALAAKQAEAAAALARQQALERRKFIPVDQRRVADIGKIQQALRAYVEKIGPLPAPYEYGEAQHSAPGFFQNYWDVSSEDGDHDGKPFLDFLVEKGILPSVPVDPDNKADPGDPRTGRQYVYFVASPDEKYGGGSCAADTKAWVYLLGITDLQSEAARPPANLSGSGCECLWRQQPNFFQQQFDYVVCGTFKR
jgi:hypothetical protein